MAIFKTRLIKWGNSIGVNIPKPIRDTLKLNDGDSVELIDKEDHFIIKKSEVEQARDAMKKRKRDKH